jgi:hypothetical protein
MPVEVKGLIETKRALKKFTPDLYKVMNQEIRAALKTVVVDARAKVQPTVNGLYNWQDKGAVVKSRSSRYESFPKYNPLVIRKGLTYRLGNSKRNSFGFVGTYLLLNKSRAGSIIETAGRKNWGGDPRSQSNNPKAGAWFNQSIQGTYGGTKSIGKTRFDEGRLLFKAFYEDQGKVTDAVFAAIDKAVRNYDIATKTGATDLYSYKSSYGVAA